MRVAITGAAGLIGRHLVPGLLGVGHDVCGIDLVRPEAPWADRITVADLAADDGALATVAARCDAIVHLAAIAGESDFESAVASHLGLTHRVLEAARQLGIGRVIYASSNHAVGFTLRGMPVTIEMPVRPDSLYGVGKAAAEALCSLYHDRHGLAIACLRIGSFRLRPGSRRELSTWLSVPDAVRLVDACLTAPDLGFAIVYGISNNTRAWWDLAPGRSLGYHPVDDAEAWAVEIEATPPTEDDELDSRHVGGSFAR
ncbi:MAG: NAD(P)-dependent oxidoreductase [Acidimicrobiia bacterium]|nr:NAD(P)-dependent oxidoreductase [Acidimicrobiia bacterium]